MRGIDPCFSKFDGVTPGHLQGAMFRQWAIEQNIIATSISTFFRRISMKWTRKMMMAGMLAGAITFAACDNDTDVKEDTTPPEDTTAQVTPVQPEATPSTTSSSTPSTGSSARTSTKTTTVTTTTTQKSDNPVKDASQSVRKTAKEVQETVKDVNETKKEAEKTIEDVKGVFGGKK